MKYNARKQNISIPGPDADAITPIPRVPQIQFLKNLITSEFIEVGDFTYVDDPKLKGNFEDNVLYHYPFIGDKLIIGKFCTIANDVTFIMNGANHSMTGASTYPFYLFGNGWEQAKPQDGELPYKGDTVIGNDVWVGTGVKIMPGVSVGNGAILASYAVVAKDVPPYAIVGGNPAKSLRQRFDQETINRLLNVAWWDWPIERITTMLTHIRTGNLDALEAH